MGSDDTGKQRRSYAAPPSVVLAGIFSMGLGMGVVLTLVAASSVPDRDPVLETKPQLLRKGGALSAPSIMRPDFWIETVSDVPGPRIFVVSTRRSTPSLTFKPCMTHGFFSGIVAVNAVREASAHCVKCVQA